MLNTHPSIHRTSARLIVRASAKRFAFANAARSSSISASCIARLAASARNAFNSLKISSRSSIAASASSLAIRARDSALAASARSSVACRSHLEIHISRSRSRSSFASASSRSSARTLARDRSTTASFDGVAFDDGVVAVADSNCLCSAAISRSSAAFARSTSGERASSGRIDAMAARAVATTRAAPRRGARWRVRTLKVKTTSECDAA